MGLRRIFFLASWILVLALTGGARGEVLWWEAESAARTNFSAKSWFSPANEKEAAVLSGGQWVSADKDRAEPLFLEYNVKTGRDGNFTFYARKFWKHGPFRWRIDAGAWTECGKDVALLDEATVRPLVVANWVCLGDVKLPAGEHVVRVELTENKGAAAFDCFLLTTEPFVPRGKLKPGEKWNVKEAGWFAFEPDADRFGDSPIDWRSLNEKFAGENGFIQARGEEFVHAKSGEAVRFWAVNTGVDTVKQPRASIDYMARHFAKLGINMVRIHGPLWKSDDYTQTDLKTLEQYQYFVAAMKREG